MSELFAPFPCFIGLDGEPVDAGFVYIGEVGQDAREFPISVFWDSALSEPASQPLDTSAGYVTYQGDVSNVFMAETGFSLTVLDKKRRVVFEERYNYGVASLADLSGASGASLVGYTEAGTGAVLWNVQDKLRDKPSITGFETSALRSAVRDFSFSLNATTALTSALAATASTKQRLDAPAGGYLVDPFELVPTGSNHQSYSLSFRGARAGNPFANNYGTVFKATSAASPLLSVNHWTSGAPGDSAGTVDIGDVGFLGTTNAGVPLLQLKEFYGLSTVEHVVVDQDGEGDGVRIENAATAEISHSYFVGDTVHLGEGTTRHGTGLRVDNQNSYGLLKLRGLTSRGWTLGYNIGSTDPNLQVLAPKMDSCEISYCTSGVQLNVSVVAPILDNTYFEGVDDTLVKCSSRFATFINCFNIVADDKPYPRIGYDFTAETAVGPTMVGGVVYVPPSGSDGTKQTYGILVSAEVGDKGWHNIFGKTIAGFSGLGGTDAMVGLSIAGVKTKVNALVNFFPSQNGWDVGASATPILDSSTDTFHGAEQGASFGLQTGFGGDGTEEIVVLKRGEIREYISDRILTESDVAAGVLTIPSAGTVWQFEPTVATTITSINVPGGNINREIALLYNGNARFQSTTLLRMPRENGHVLSATSRGGIAVFKALRSGTPTYQCISLLDRGLGQPMYAATVAALTALASTDVREYDEAWAIDGRKPGEGVGAGTGVKAWWDGSAWRSQLANAVLAA